MSRWGRPLSEGGQSVPNEERSGRPSLISDDLVELMRKAEDVCHILVPFAGSRVLRLGIQKLIPRYKCLNSSGGYVENNIAVLVANKYVPESVSSFFLK
ncbi:hypothetical protein TNIN_346381 [Trichonephila inaurata madagascariensis]|uniref:Uncharacterized protein n=1 Tax=Trichonephila inaurata madagascariensis TaxID=2747483 RepID=A0A8X6XHY2_9ARAC|nr:hypothetical protein TNIN_346381 [Trichonephila inaurata madagascariensis]